MGRAFLSGDLSAPWLRHEAQASLPAETLAVDTADCAPPAMARFRVFNPFQVDRARPLHVPGTSNVAWSVEAIWQGTKIVDGRTAHEMFQDTPRKRPPEEERLARSYRYADSTFLFGDTQIDLVTARYAIYLPAYLELLAHPVTSPAIQEIRAHLDALRPVAFYDWDANFDIEDDGAPFSHSAVLAAWFGGRIEERCLRPGRAWLRNRPEVASAALLLDLDRRPVPS